ncbi:MAG TPA: AAA domain-containing protein, partial [Nannocystaceae bacterium]|nr:AAA domain-containing protein [Nannocystaceae bacterium]
MSPDIYPERLVFTFSPELRCPRPVGDWLHAFSGPDAKLNEALVDYLRLVLPEGAPTTLYVANVSRESNPQENHRNLLFRPPCEGPRAGDYGRGTHTLAFSTYRKQGRLVVASLEVTPHVPLRGFEARVSAPVFWTNALDLYMSREDFDALGGLPAHRLRTIARLRPWRRYLEWKEDLIRRSQIEIPYIAYRRLNDTCFAFLVREQHLPERPLSQVEFDVADPHTGGIDELDPDDLDDVPRRPGKRPPDPIRLGIFDRKEAVDPRQAHPWGKIASPGQVQVVVRVDEDQARKLDGRDLPSPGRLLSSIAGELKPLRLQASGITRLESSQGFCPRLVDFLFDARNASAPTGSEPLPPIDGGRDLNDGQQEAVRKALASPDLCLIQGPPGTGKTTVIAEICLRIAMQGGRVLVASQTNLAVDNALSRLADRPAVRRLRLGAPDKVDEEFKDFLAENVISRWFRTIADQCHRRIDVADSLRDEREARRRGLADLRSILAAHARAEQAALAERARVHALATHHEAATKAHTQARHAAEAARIDATRARALADWATGGPFPSTALGEGALGQSATQLAELATSAARHASLGRLAETLATIRLDTTSGESSPEIAGLRRRQRILAESEDDEDLAELKQVNRRLKKLEEDGWLATGRLLRQAAAEAFPSGPPASIDVLRDALKPSDALASTLAEAIETVRSQLEAATAARACVTALSPPFAAHARPAAQSHADALPDRRGEHAEGILEQKQASTPLGSTKIERHIEQQQRCTDALPRAHGRVRGQNAQQ